METELNHRSRRAFRMRLKPEYRAEYRQRHNPVWPELAELFRSSGVLEYQIFLDPADGTLFGHVRLAPDSRWDEIPENPLCRRWWKFMKELMQTEADGTPVTVELEKVFDLQEN